MMPVGAQMVAEVPTKVMVPVRVEAQMLVEVPTNVTIMVPVEAQEHRRRCQWRHRWWRSCRQKWRCWCQPVEAQEHR